MNPHKPAWAAPDDNGMAHRNGSRGAAPVWGADPSKAKKLLISADVPDGFIPNHPDWPVLLDGVLAWVGRRIMRGIPPRQHDRHVDSIPLIRDRFRPSRLDDGTRHPDQNRGSNAWIWAASCAVFETDNIEQRWFGRRTDIPGERSRTGVTRRVNPSTGPDKAVWSPRRVVIPGRVFWRAVGDPEELQRWLAQVPSIGKARRAGNGRVSRWAIDEVGECDTSDSRETLGWAAGIRADGHLCVGRLLRPLPVYARMVFPLEQFADVSAEYRPPYIDPRRTSKGHREMTKAIAAYPMYY